MPKFFTIAGLGDLGKIRTETKSGVPGSVDSPQGGESTLIGGKTIISDFKRDESIKSESNKQVVIGDFEVKATPFATIAESKESVLAPYSTLFNDLRFEAIPHYNFFTEDEEVNDTLTRGARKLSDLPRYVQLRWRQAPVTDNPPVYTMPPPSNKRVRSSTLRVGLQVRPLSRRGINFDKKTSEQFSVIKDSTSNGFIHPGVITSVVELPLEKAGFSVIQTVKVDEQLFLQSKSTEGLSIHDVQANINAQTNGLLGASNISSRVVSKDTKTIQKELFDNKFSVSMNNDKKILSAGSATSIKIKDVASASPVMTLHTSTAAQSSKGTGQIAPVDQLEQIMYETVSKPLIQQEQSDFTEVSFVNPAIIGLISQDKIDTINSPEHAENTSGLAQFMPNLTVISELSQDIGRKKEPPSFPAIQEDSGTVYVGYVIEKYRQGKDGIFQLIEEIEIPDVICTEYIDAKVVYGGIYRYRIRTILKWTRRGNVTHGGFEQGNFFDEDFTQTKGLATHKSSYFHSEWNRKWKYAAILDTVDPDPPDEFTVRSESHKKRIVISWKLPYNPQKDIQYYRLFRKTQDINGNDLSDWELVDIRLGALNVLYIDNDVDFFQNNNTVYVYAAQTVTRHNEFSKLSCQRGVRLNQQFKFSGEYPIKNVSGEGVLLGSIGAFSVNPPKKIFEKVIAKKSIVVTLRDGINDNPFLNSTYILRFESLDTGETKDIKIDTIYDNGIEPEIIEKSNITHVPQNPSDKGIGLKSIFSSTVSMGSRGTSTDSSATGIVRKTLPDTRLK